MKVYVELLLLAAVWGASFLFLRISSPEFGPIPLIFVRTALASLVLIPFVLIAQQQKDIFDNWRLFLVVGAISTAIPFSLFSYTSLYLSAGYTSILNATTPFFSAIVAYCWLSERLNLLGVLGLIIGFVGVYLLSHFNVGLSDTTVFLPIIAALVATFLYAVSSSYVRLKMCRFKPLTVAAGSQLFSALILLPFAVLSWPSKLPGTTAWVSAVSMAIFSTAFALIVFFRLLQSVGVTKTVSVTYLIPVFGVLWGYLFLGESITLQMILGGLLILFGVSLTTGIYDRWLVAMTSHD